MATYRVYFTSVLTSAIDVDVEDEDNAVDRAYDEFRGPRICAQCAGWGRETEHVDQGDWEVADETRDVEHMPDL